MLDAIAAWELDAGLEPPERYYLRTGVIDRIESGSVSVVIGARGSGKTAATRHMTANGTALRPTARIGLKDAFMAALRPLASPAARTQASATARYLILLGAFEAIMEEKFLVGSQIRELAQEFAVTLDPQVAQALPLIFNRTVLYEVFGESREIASDTPVPDVRARIGPLEVAVARALGERQVFVLFDEAVDRSIIAGAFDALRVDALSVLLGGVFDLASGPAGAVVCPVVFTRPGLFNRLSAPERERWNHRRLDISWSSQELREISGFRVARSADAFAANIHPEAALRRAFKDAVRGVETRDGAVWSFIWPRTRARPRDAVFFIRAAARNARHRGLDHFDPKTLIQAEKTYSAFLLQDMADEIRDVAPDVEDVLAAISRHGKRRMSATELIDVIESALAEAEFAEGVAGARGTIERLFEASAIGNWVGDGRGAHTRFSYDDPSAGLDYGAPVAIHPGLVIALDLELEAAA